MTYEKLRSEVEGAFSRTPSTASDFYDLSERIFERTHERISPTTLKRLWGYVNEDVQPRLFTLNVLSRFVGYSDYVALTQSDGETQSNLILSEHITDKDIARGQRVRLMWQPGRVCVVEHLGCGRFKVVEAQRTKLSVGDTFTCRLIMMHEPLFLDNLIHDGGAPTGYVAGRKDGVTFEIMNNE